jgi:hypothetical protein
VFTRERNKQANNEVRYGCVFERIFSKRIKGFVFKEVNLSGGWVNVSDREENGNKKAI